MPNNPLFEVHVWLTAKVTDENGLGCFDEMYGYDNKEEALAKFNEIKTFSHKLIMAYESAEDDADGNCIAEELNY
tara:strand:- start:4400 stop:4624 length:225 start_codon:yes stop_codon:yes gene_type:complete